MRPCRMRAGAAQSPHLSHFLWTEQHWDETSGTAGSGQEQPCPPPTAEPEHTKEHHKNHRPQLTPNLALSLETPPGAAQRGGLGPPLPSWLRCRGARPAGPAGTGSRGCPRPAHCPGGCSAATGSVHKGRAAFSHNSPHNNPATATTPALPSLRAGEPEGFGAERVRIMSGERGERIH